MTDEELRAFARGYHFGYWLGDGAPDEYKEEGREKLRQLLLRGYDRGVFDYADETDGGMGND